MGCGWVSGLASLYHRMPGRANFGLFAFANPQNPGPETSDVPQRRRRVAMVLVVTDINSGDLPTGNFIAH